MLALAVVGVNLLVCGAFAAVLMVLRAGPASETQADDGFGTAGQQETVTGTVSSEDAFPTEETTSETTTSPAPPVDWNRSPGRMG